MKISGQWDGEMQVTPQYLTISNETQKKRFWGEGGGRIAWGGVRARHVGAGGGFGGGLLGS